jgi:hypothetical protein
VQSRRPADVANSGDDGAAVAGDGADADNIVAIPMRNGPIIVRLLLLWLVLLVLSAVSKMIVGSSPRFWPFEAAAGAADEEENADAGEDRGKQ